MREDRRAGRRQFISKKHRSLESPRFGRKGRAGLGRKAVIESSVGLFQQPSAEASVLIRVKSSFIVRVTPSKDLLTQWRRAL